MSQIKIVDNEYITLECLPDDGIIHHTIHQPFDGESFREAIEAGTEALKTYGATKWLSDDRKNGPLSEEDADWGFTDWNRRAIAAGWKYWAMVVPEELIAAGSLTSTIHDLSSLGLQTRVFTKVDDAMRWLKERDD